jgi:hypothetical protein
MQSYVYPFLFFSRLHLLLEEILGTEEMPEHISSDSSLEEEDTTPEQRINHQLCRRVRHLEHELRDITARETSPLAAMPDANVT